MTQDRSLKLASATLVLSGLIAACGAEAPEPLRVTPEVPMLAEVERDRALRLRELRAELAPVIASAQLALSFEVLGLPHAEAAPPEPVEPPSAEEPAEDPGGPVAVETSLITEHEGTLTITPGTDLSELRELEVIHGDLVLDHARWAVTLPALRTVDGVLSIERSEQLEVVDLPSLQLVQRVVVSANRDLRTLRLPALRFLGDAEACLNDASAGDLLLSRNVQLTTLALDSLATVGELTFADNPRLGRFDLPSLLCTTGGINVRGGRALFALTAEALTHIAGDLSLDWLGELQRLRLPALRVVDGQLDLRALPSLLELDLTQLEDVGGALGLRGGMPVAHIMLPALRSVGRPHVGVTVEDLTGPTRIHLPSLEILPGPLTVARSEHLEAVGLGALKDLGGDLRFEDNRALEVLSLPVLANYSGDFVVRDNDRLERLDLRRLEVPRQDLCLIDNDALVFIEHFETLIFTQDLWLCESTGRSETLLRALGQRLRDEGWRVRVTACGWTDWGEPGEALQLDVEVENDWSPEDRRQID